MKGKTIAFQHKFPGDVGEDAAAVIDRMLDSSDARDKWYQDTIDRLMDTVEKLIAKHP